MTAPFTIKGDLAQWEMIYNRIKEMSPGDLITREELAVIVPDYMGPLHKAIQVLGERDQRTLENVRGVGYKMVHAPRHVGIAKNRRLRAKRQVTKGVRVLNATRIEELDAQQRMLHDSMQDRMTKHEAMLKKHDARITALESATKTVKREHREDIAQLSQKVDTLTEVLAAAGMIPKTDEHVSS